MQERGTQTQAEPARQGERSNQRSGDQRIRSASEVLRILEPPSLNSKSVVPTGFWKTGWLPSPEGAAS